MIHVSVWHKTLEYCIVISLQLNKFFKKEHEGGSTEMVLRQGYEES